METGAAEQKVVYVDASVLINFLHLDRLDLFSALKELRFVTPQEVEQEILQPEQRAGFRGLYWPNSSRLSY